MQCIRFASRPGYSITPQSFVLTHFLLSWAKTQGIMWTLQVMVSWIHKRHSNALSPIHCPQAYKQGLYGGKYAWLLIGWYQSRWWEIHTKRASKLKCKTKHVTEAFGNYISTEFRKIGPSSPDVIGGEVGGLQQQVIFYWVTFNRRLII